MEPVEVPLDGIRLPSDACSIEERTYPIASMEKVFPVLKVFGKLYIEERFGQKDQISNRGVVITHVIPRRGFQKYRLRTLDISQGFSRGG